MTRSKLCGAMMRRDGGYVMSLVRTGTAVPTRRDLLGALFATLLAVAMFEPGESTAQEVKQVKLTEKHIQGFISAHEDMAKRYDDADPNKPDPKGRSTGRRGCEEKWLCESRRT
jgi:hypothetical protein